ncbi:DUF1830 domain-containing protein [Pseudanabaena sp. lw0831]|uniref:DUF1830 domain-containing protein n=1 Tax=Pseudanabaena sp. lw0831 TaxID=1357935 RepID=UPI0019166433|nr:DUF1830 domain-containing protein [Pseudanabaena sp. lw0831]
MLNSDLHKSNKKPYRYINQTKRIQIIRLQIGLDECIERAVFPEDEFCFEAPSDAYLEISTYTIATAVLSDRIPCQQL